MVFNKTEEQWKQLGAYWTSREIFQQPSTWLKTLDQIRREKDAIRSFISQVTSQYDYDVILTGAGSSEFVGNSILPFLSPLNQYKVKSYATTDIVACPERYLSAEKATLMISFGRSGNSPESVAAVETANIVCDRIFHLFVTCNSAGVLSKFAEGRKNCYALNRTSETHDQAFAMTSSFSNMYLAAVLCFLTDRLDEAEAVIKDTAERTEEFHKQGFE